MLEIAQTTVSEASLSDLLKIAGSLSASAVLVIIAAWAAKYGFPKLMATFEKVATDQNAAMERMQASFIAENRTIRAEHREDVKTIASSHAAAYDRLADTLVELKDAIHK